MDNPSYPTTDRESRDGPSPEFVWTRTERALADSADALFKIAIHEKECALRFVEVRNDLSIMRFWMRLGTIALVVLFLATFLHLDAAHIVKLISPASIVP